MFAFLRKETVGDALVNGWSPDRFCTDYAELQRKMWWRLFVYNDWQDNQTNNEMLGEDAIKCAAAFTKEDNFVVLKKKLGRDTFPFALPMGAENAYGRESFLGPTGKILGQLYKVRPKTIKALDNEVLQGVQFDRVRIKVEVPYRDYLDQDRACSISDPKIATFDAWAYIGRLDFWLEGHGINDKYIGDVRRFCTVRNNLNHDKESKVYYYYNDRFELEDSSE